MLTFSHKPVLLSEVLDTFAYLRSKNGGCFVDGTLGAGGHSIALKLKVKNEKLKVIGIDKDQQALNLAAATLANARLQDQFSLVHDDFKNIKQILSDLRIEKINGALIDLGVSSMQLDDKERGFSFENPESLLDMRMDQEQTLSAFEIINYWSQKKLETLLLELGEERFWRQIAKNICRARKSQPIRTVGELINVLKSSIPAKVRFSSGKHFATNVFRALRIAVNEELEDLDKTLADFVEQLKPMAKLAVISFHSTEDRIVKETFRHLENPCVCPPELPVCACGKKPVVKVLTRKPIIPSDEEIQSNPRARSAKLRVAERLNF